MKRYSDISLSTDEEAMQRKAVFSYETYDRNAALEPKNELDSDSNLEVPTDI